MAFYLIGLGLDKDTISKNAFEILKNCDKIYLESYTIEFPYKLEELKNCLDVNFRIIEREELEETSFLKEAKEKNIALLIYGDPLSATTHSELLLFCKKNKIPFKVFHNSSIFNVVSETGLFIYKFGKTCSIPKWTKGFKPVSFADYIKENLSVKAHTLILVDIGLIFQDALKQLEIACEEKKIELKKLIVIQKAGTSSQKILFGDFDSFKKMINIEAPFSFIIPSELNFKEEEFLKSYGEEIL
ncbi:MAG: diphthine synthase [Candidatus Pacearchaeota archaeon]